MWLRQHAPENAAKLLNRDVLAPMPGGRFAFGRLTAGGADGVTLLADGHRQKPGICGTTRMAGRCRDAGPQALGFMRVLSIATLFPNPVRPSFGVFVGNQMRTVVAQGGWT